MSVGKLLSFLMAVWYKVELVRVRAYEIHSLLANSRWIRSFASGSTRRLVLAIVAWAFAVLAGFVGFARYEGRAGAQVLGPLKWPVETLTVDSGYPTLVVAVHPRCPCTRATLAELEQIMTQAGDRVRAYVVFMHWGDGEDEGVETSLGETAQRIVGVRLIRDEGSVVRRFGALTSGQTYLYDERGKLVFQGGITRARGQVGDNEGKSAILAYLNSRVRNFGQTPTYGCELFSTEVSRGE